MTVGFYRPTAAFASEPEHIAVMVEGTGALIAITGPSDPRTNVAESMAHAAIFVSSLQLLDVVRTVASDPSSPHSARAQSAIDAMPHKLDGMMSAMGAALMKHLQEQARLHLTARSCSSPKPATPPVDVRHSPALRRTIMTSRFITKAYGPGQNAVGEIGDDGEFVEYDVKPSQSSALDWVAKAKACRGRAHHRPDDGRGQGCPLENLRVSHDARTQGHALFGVVTFIFLEDLASITQHRGTAYAVHLCRRLALP